MSEPKFTLQSLELLQKYFPVEGSSADQISFHRLKGYLTAIACAPESVSFSQWWDALKAQPELEMESDQTENELLPLMMTLMDKTIETLEAGQVAAPEPVELSQYDYGTTPIEQWCSGFMDGLKLSEEAWFAKADEKEREALELSFGVVVLLASRENMKRKVDAEQFDERMNSAQEVLPQVIQGLFHIAKDKK